MYNTYEVPGNADPSHFLGWAAAVARGAPGRMLNAVVLNCHGFYGTGMGGKTLGGFGLNIGKGILRADTSKFTALAGMVGSIWITACGAARISGSPAGDGHAFCAEIARSSKAYVIAGTTRQIGTVWLPQGYIDDYEGLVVRYNPLGNVDWHYDYGRSLLDGMINGWD
jgi:hypothetical protein